MLRLRRMPTEGKKKSQCGESSVNSHIEFWASLPGNPEQAASRELGPGEEALGSGQQFVEN